MSPTCRSACIGRPSSIARSCRVSFPRPRSSIGTSKRTEGRPARLASARSMWGYIARRLLATIPVVAIVALVVFSILHVAPGDPAALIAGDQATPEQIAAIRAKLRLDLPLYQQFALWLGNALAGDLGTSIFSNRPVATLFLQRLEPTVALAVLTTIVAVALAVPAGVLAAWRSGSLIDRSVMGMAVLGFAFPVFVVGFIFLFFFAIKLRILPIPGFWPIRAGRLPVP